MAKKKASDKLAIGTRVRAKSGVTAPEFPDVPCEGWTGTITELSGKKSDPMYVIEWDAATVDNMPADYRQQCEERNLFYGMACFGRGEIDPCED